MMEGPPYRQLELVAHDITVGVLARHLAVTGIKISIKRSYVPIAGPVHSQGITLSFCAEHAAIACAPWSPETESPSYASQPLALQCKDAMLSVVCEGSMLLEVRVH